MPWTDVKNKILSLNPSFYSTLGRKDGNIDLSENSYSMLAQGGMVIGNSIKDPIRLRGYGSTEFDGIDDRVVSSYGTRRNLCTNPRAAVGTTGVINSGLASIDAVDAPTLDGLPTGITRAYHCVATGSGQSIRFSIPVVSGNTYHFSFYFRAGATGLYQLHAANESHALRAERIINALPVTIPDSVEAEPLGAFVRADLDFVADSTGTWTLRANANVASDFWVTAVLAEESSALGPYFDGDGYVEDDVWHPNVYSLSWEGTPNNSISTKEDSTGKRQNLWPNPKAEDLDGVNAYSGATVTPVVFKDEGIPNLLLGGKEFTKGYKVETTTSNQGVSANITTVPGEDYAHSAYVYVISGEVDVSIAGHGNGGNAHPQSSWQRVTYVTSASKPDSTTETFAVRSANDNTVFYVTAILSEKANTIGNYFDGDGYIDNQGNWKTSPNEKTGWLGTPRESPSDKGVFANGTTRTFTGWAYRDTMDSQDVLWGSTVDEAEHPRLTLAANNDNVTFAADQSVEVGSWSNAWVGIGKWAHWALVFDEANDEAELFINGESQGVVTHEAQWPATPGDFQIAARRGSLGYFDGKMAHVAVFERALTPEEIAEIYDLAINPPPIPFSEHDAEIVLLNPEEYGIVVLNEEITGFETNTDVNN